MLPMTYIEARDIPDAWFQSVYKILDIGFRYEIQSGSYVGQTRLEFDWITVQILHPYSEPYDTMVPEIPSHLSIPNPVSPGYIESYIPYLMTEHKEPNEDYTYGSRIWPQVPHFIDLLRKTPNTNQAILQVAQADDYKLHDPPCLRH
ncbi:MAG: thymidylate synthase, partial [Thermodesulfobacteriota bacterium]|nr:thymidylate synthase [Thermodesulfobacteriota bacterium]